MPHFNVKIQSLDDVNDESLKLNFKNKNRDKIIKLVITDVLIMEGGMISGKTSLAMRLEDGFGNEYLTETSAELWCATASAIQGANMRFEELKEQRKKGEDDGV